VKNYTYLLKLKLIYHKIELIVNICSFNYSFSLIIIQISINNNLINCKTNKKTLSKIQNSEKNTKLKAFKLFIETILFNSKSSIEKIEINATKNTKYKKKLTGKHLFIIINWATNLDFIFFWTKKVNSSVVSFQKGEFITIESKNSSIYKKEKFATVWLLLYSL
jgi:hypothetical protein